MASDIDIKRALLQEVSAAAFRELGDLSAKLTEQERQDYEACLQSMAVSYLTMASGSVEDRAKAAADLKHVETQLAILEAKLKVKLYNRFMKLVESSLLIVMRVAIKAALGGI